MSKYQLWWLVLLAFTALCFADLIFKSFTGVNLFYDNERGDYTAMRALLGIFFGTPLIIAALNGSHMRADK